MVSTEPSYAKPQARIAAIVLNYRTPELVEDCLRSIVPELRSGVDRIVVVDNASGDGSAERIDRFIQQQGSPMVELVESPVNGGFAAGNNVGIRSVEAQAYLLLNSDTLVRPGAPEQLWATLQSDARIGLCSPRLEWLDGTPQISCFRYHSPFSELIAGSRTGPIRTMLDHWDVPLPLRNEPFDPQWTSFAAVMIRREVFERVGLLDEGFFMYYEDVDFCRRAVESGFRVHHDPRPRVVHLRGGSSPVKELTAARKRRPRYYYESRSRYFRKAYGQQGPLLANGLWTVGRSVAWLREHLGRKLPHTVEREFLDNWRG
jgi:GT2 family glycosyltransferase